MTINFAFKGMPITFALFLKLKGLKVVLYYSFHKRNIIPFSKDRKGKVLLIHWSLKQLNVTRGKIENIRKEMQIIVKLVR
jgi:hypothetical protein